VWPWWASRPADEGFLVTPAAPTHRNAECTARNTASGQHQKASSSWPLTPTRGHTEAGFSSLIMVLARSATGDGGMLTALYGHPAVLILAPKTLLWQWQDEMRHLLDLPSAVWTGKQWVDDSHRVSRGRVQKALKNAAPGRPGGRRA